EVLNATKETTKTIYTNISVTLERELKNYFENKETVISELTIITPNKIELNTLTVENCIISHFEQTLDTKLKNTTKEFIIETLPNTIICEIDYRHDKNKKQTE
uniref:hypothetical protein n=1 Tax=Methanohalobium sp. TaxID=2837493 RepID=UPI0025E62A2F